jgi:hypothetical protein
MNNLFDFEKIEQRIKEIKEQPPFTSDKYEPQYQVSQLFPDDKVVILFFVIRDGQPFFYNQITNYKS